MLIVGQDITLCGLVPTGNLGEGDTEQCAVCATDWRAGGEEPWWVQRTPVAIEPLPTIGGAGSPPVDARPGPRNPPEHAGPGGRREPGRHG